MYIRTAMEVFSLYVTSYRNEMLQINSVWIFWTLFIISCYSTFFYFFLLHDYMYSCMKHKTIKISEEAFVKIKKYCHKHHFQIGAWASDVLRLETMDLPEQLEEIGKYEDLEKEGK